MESINPASSTCLKLCSHHFACSDIPEVGKFEPGSDTPNIKLRDIISDLREKKYKLASLPLHTKIIKISIYSKCDHANQCACHGYFSPAVHMGNIMLNDCGPCSNCNHPFISHSVHLLKKTFVDVNRMLNVADDIENIFLAAFNEEDDEMKELYHYVMRNLRNCLETLQRPTFESNRKLLATLPFEKPDIKTSLENFFHLNYGCKSTNVKEKMLMVKNLVERNLNYIIYEKPATSLQSANQTEEESLRKLNYVRWNLLCHFPLFFETLHRFQPCLIFGRKFLVDFFPEVREGIAKLQENQFQPLPNFNHSTRECLFKFLKEFEEAISNASNPIWDTNYNRSEKRVVVDNKSNENDRKVKIRLCSNGSTRYVTIKGKKLISSRPNMSLQINIPPKIEPNLDPSQVDKLVEVDPFMYDKFNQEKVDSIVKELSVINDRTTSEIRRKKKANKLKKKSSAAGPQTQSTSAIGSRDILAHAERESGVLKHYLLGNSRDCYEDMTYDAMRYMITLADIFTHLLTQMPRNYIMRLMFDGIHRTIALVKDEQPVAGITFRMFERSGFAEVVFCVVTSNQQVKGYGTYMMNFLKDYLLNHKIHTMLAYADKSAVGYFKKQNFSEDVNLDNAVYANKIKNYENAVLMQCSLNSHISYADFGESIRRDKAILEHFIDSIPSPDSSVQVTLPTHYPSRKLIPLELIPAYKKCMRPREKDIEESLDFDTLIKKIRATLTAVKKCPSSWPFLKPVSKVDVPDYYDHIKYPMDLKKMTERVKKSYYVARRLFIGDMRRMISNCRLYNAPDTQYYKCADEIEKVFEAKLKEVGLI